MTTDQQAIRKLKLTKPGSTVKMLFGNKLQTMTYIGTEIVNGIKYYKCKDKTPRGGAVASYIYWDDKDD